MTGLIKSLRIALLVMITAVLVTGCSSNFTSPREGGATPSGLPDAPTPGQGLIQSDTGGSVTIDVEWLKEPGSQLTFEVAMNTHSVDLDQYDLAELATLRDDKGNEYRPVSWNAPAGGHHRTGTLTFPVPPTVDQETTKYIEIIIRNVAGIEQRVLKWEL